MDGASGLWYVQLADGDVHRVTLDQLDEGFQAGHIDGDTMVLAAGAAQWAKLGKLADIDEVAPVGAPPPTPAHVAPAAMAAVPAPRPSHTASPSDAVPVALQPASLPATLLESDRPVSVDLGDLALEAGLPRRSGKRWLAALVGLALVGGTGTLAMRRPGLVRPYVSRVGHYAVAAKSWAAAAVSPRRVSATEDPPAIQALHIASALTPPPAVAASEAPATAPASEGPSPASRPAGREIDAPKPRLHDGDKPPATKGKPRKAHPATARPLGSSVP
jgi:hypothetical protein